MEYILRITFISTQKQFLSEVLSFSGDNPQEIDDVCTFTNTISPHLVPTCCAMFTSISCDWCDARRERGRRVRTTLLLPESFDH